MPKNLSEDLCWRIVYLHHDGYSNSNKKIRELLSLVLAEFIKFGDVSVILLRARGEEENFLMLMTWRLSID